MRRVTRANRPEPPGSDERCVKRQTIPTPSPAASYPDSSDETEVPVRTNPDPRHLPPAARYPDSSDHDPGIFVMTLQYAFTF
jgi:hypothetical protein